MNKYRDKSDFEINKAVAVAIGAKPFPPERTEFKQCEIPGLENAIIVKITGVKMGPFDPCNNPADAKPIIIENKIAIAFSSNTGKWCAYAWCMMGDRGWDIYERPTICAFSDNYYRAAMEVFLMMKDAENEKI
ncbi:TPA: DUF2591 family protein [Morganella morganii]|nr:DUF2591 family protein [Morganella morganii]